MSSYNHEDQLVVICLTQLWRWPIKYHRVIYIYGDVIYLQLPRSQTWTLFAPLLCHNCGGGLWSIDQSVLPLVSSTASRCTTDWACSGQCSVAGIESPPTCKLGINGLYIVFMCVRRKKWRFLYPYGFSERPDHITPQYLIKYHQLRTPNLQLEMYNHIHIISSLTRKKYSY